MSNKRYSIIGLGRPRSRWFSDVASWTTSGAVPADFHKCLSASDARQKLNALRPYSALIVEEGLADVDRSLLEAAREAKTATFVVCATSTVNQWLEMGATATLSPNLSPADLTQALVSHASINEPAIEKEIAATIEKLTTPLAPLIAVCGAGGTGASTIAAVLAQASASDVTSTNHVLLADFARNSDQAMLHNSAEVTPGIEDLVESHRSHRFSRDYLRSLTYAIESRGYRLLLGQRRVGAWTALSPASVRSALVGLRQTFRLVVADITADFENESHSGSSDVEERNALALSTVKAANLMFVVGTPDLKGIHSLVRLMKEIAETGYDTDRIVPVINRAPRRGLTRVEISRALPELCRVGKNGFECRSPIFVPERTIENVVRNTERFPKHIVRPLNSVIDVLLNDVYETDSETEDQPELIVPGTLGLSAS